MAGRLKTLPETPLNIPDSIVHEGFKERPQLNEIDAKNSRMFRGVYKGRVWPSLVS